MSNKWNYQPLNNELLEKRDELEKARKAKIAQIDINIALIESEIYLAKARTTQ